MAMLNNQRVYSISMYKWGCQFHLEKTHTHMPCLSVVVVTFLEHQNPPTRVVEAPQLCWWTRLVLAFAAQNVSEHGLYMFVFCLLSVTWLLHVCFKSEFRSIRKSYIYIYYSLKFIVHALVGQECMFWSCRLCCYVHSMLQSGPPVESRFISPFNCWLISTLQWSPP